MTWRGYKEGFYGAGYGPCLAQCTQLLTVPFSKLKVRVPVKKAAARVENGQEWRQ